MGNKIRLVSIFLFLISIFIYFLTSGGHTHFNHFTLLADSFLNGRLYIEGYMPWLEKIPITEEAFYVANPPMPAILAIIPVVIFEKNLPQEYLAHVVASFMGVIVFLIATKLKPNIKLGVWSYLLISFGTLNWYLAAVGSTWYFAHIVSETFIFAAIYLLLRKVNPVIIGLMLGFSYLSRIPTILLLPFFLLNLPKPFFKNAFLLGLGIFPSILFNFLYNYARFGVIWDIGYTMIPGVSTEPWYQKGVVHPSYVWEHIKIIFTSLPEIPTEFPLGKPSTFGYAIWFTTPVFIFALFNNLKQKIIWSSWIAIIIVAILIFSHGSTGFSQFGYRFAADFYPILTFLTITAVAKQNGPKWYHWIFLLVSILVNFWGVISLYS